MYTLDEMKAVLDAEGSDTLDGYNLIRTNVMSMSNEAIREAEDLRTKLANMEQENARLKQANMTLYSRVESQIMKPPAMPPEQEPEEPEEVDYDAVLKDNIKSYLDF